MWDPREAQIFCARDHFGKRPFYYHHSRASCSYSHRMRARSSSTPQVPFAINKGRVADFLVPALEWIDYTSTFFEGVVRLPPGHTLAVTADASKVSEYWKPAPGPALDFEDETTTIGRASSRSSRAAVDARLRAPADSGCRNAQRRHGLGLGRRRGKRTDGVPRRGAPAYLVRDPG